MAEGIFRALIAKPPYQALIKEVDSCGTGAYHVGAMPDSRTLATLAKNGITSYDHQARKVRPSDFEQFDYIFAMDEENIGDLQEIQRRAKDKAKAKLMLFGEYAGKSKAEIVEDPYYGGRDGFDKAYEQCKRFSKNFLKDVFPDVEPGPEEED